MLKNGPADRAGIKPGDILVSVDGQDITDTTRLLNFVAQIKPGSNAKIHLVPRTANWIWM